MRRYLAAVLAAAVLACTACQAPAGVDGDLTDDWAALPPAAAFVPRAGTCHPERGDADAEQQREVDCGQKHDTETVLAGTLAGPGVTATAPPAVGSPSLRAARSRCDHAANALLGADWHGGRLAMDLLLPSRAAWSRGARWYRCDLFETYSMGSDSGIPRPRRSRLAGALRPGSPLAHACFQSQRADGAPTALDAVPCAEPHDAEFAGVYTAPDRETRTGLTRSPGLVQDRCRGIIAHFAGATTREVTRRTGLIWKAPDEPEWRDGDRGVLCFLLTDRSLTRSLRDAGAAALPPG
ncbi:septum formation family protein [Plantactinospora siamensis]|uniref:Septum formation family protein n=1 Tax=Plantactinospora siamensis TaxID=555372 RepID=A0ABV6P1K3_9ACTN